MALLGTAKFDLLSLHCIAQLFWTIPTNTCELDWISIFHLLNLFSTLTILRFWLARHQNLAPYRGNKFISAALPVSSRNQIGLYYPYSFKWTGRRKTELKRWNKINMLLCNTLLPYRCLSLGYIIMPQTVKVFWWDLQREAKLHHPSNYYEWVIILVNRQKLQNS